MKTVYQKKGNFSITAYNFEQIEVIKGIAESLGWSYNYDFNPFDEITYNNHNGGVRCLYFSFEFQGHEGEPFFTISNSQTHEFDADDSLKYIVNGLRLISHIEITKEEIELRFNLYGKPFKVV